MADIVQSLFGLTPEALQQQRAAEADKMALDFAKLSPMQQAQFAIGRGAYQLGGAIGGALGGQDPELQIISTRNAIAQQIDYTNPESMAFGIQALSQAGDTVGAMQLSQVLRQMQSEMALRQQRQAAAGASQAQAAASLAQIGRERAQAIPGDIAKSREVARLMEERDRLSQIFDETGQTARQIQYIDAQISELRRPEKPESMTEAQRNAADLALDAGPVGSPEYNKKYREELRRQTTKETPDRRPSVGADREAVALDMFDKNYYDLTPTERATVNARVEREQGKKAAASAPQIIMPGQKAFADIPAFRRSVQTTIAPQLQSIDAADQALRAIDDSIRTNNFVSFNAARVQLAKALGDSQLSRRDVEQAGGDPSLLGGLYDATSRLFTGTPSLDTQNKIKATLNAIRVVADRKARAEVDVQRNIALNTPGYDAAAIERALSFPQLKSPSDTGVGAGSLADQAKAELARRQAKGK